MRLYVTFLALFGLLALSTSCGDAAGKRLETSTSKTTQLLVRGKTAVSNFGSALENQSFVAASCTSAGVPTTNYNVGNYFKDAFPCALKTNSNDTNTIQGYMSLYAGLLCAIEEVVDFNYANSVTTHTVTISSTSSCLSGISLGSAGSYTLTVKEQSLSGLNWNYQISIDLPSTGGMSAAYSGKRMYVLISENGTKKGIKVSIGTASTDSFLGLMLDIDSSTNTLRFDFYESGKHHRGVLVSSSSEFTDISSFYGAHSTAWASTNIISYYANGSGYQINTLPGPVCQTASCTGATAASANFTSYAGNQNGLMNRLTGNTDAALSFTTALPTQFLP